MKVIGLTGGIGSGKTTVAKEFEKLNVPIYIADERSKYILSNNRSVIDQVKILLGQQAYIDDNGKIEANRPFIASKVFKDKNLLEGLNKILHPAVRIDFDKFCERHHSAAYVLYEAAILFETNGDKRCDATILVTASLQKRIERVMHRDAVTEEDVLSRMKNQWTQKEKLELADFVIINDNIDLLTLKSGLIHRFMLKN
ncbi:dephospho-CoA kinase [Nonlabens arenilitoris]|uniref:Dephospho-CoA kinase n=1 Tax=Nonlabens arenilitoris TaxID=1217969 RepID=A0A2S7U665_9FLAO|nr:dephospho-CoA kinase [Nonlabens arenilitoris]PQJ30488.1 dephospho-CoA kinase [Nonlabens arenilitoris]